MRATTPSPFDGTEIAYEVSGSGEPLLLVHGSGLSKGTWRGLGYLRDLESDFTVIALDLRGHGRSGKPHDASAYVPAAFASDVDAVLDAAALGPVHYVGYSIGARIGLRLALDEPARFLTLTTIGGSFGDMHGRISSTFFPTWRDALDSGGMDEFLTRWGAFRGREVDPATAQAFRANDPLALRAFFEAVEEQPEITDVETERITVPSLLIAGTHDHPRYEQSQAAAKRMPSAAFFDLVEQDHSSSLLPVDEVSDLIRTYVEVQRSQVP